MMTVDETILAQLVDRLQQITVAKPCLDFSCRSIPPRPFVVGFLVWFIDEQGAASAPVKGTSREVEGADCIYIYIYI